MQSLVSLKYVVLDSSHLGNWIRDCSSANAVKRDKAARFQEGLIEKGIVAILSLHHLEELLGIESIEVAESRLGHIHSMPLVGWVAPAALESGIGSVVDVLAAELRTALALRNSDAVSIRDEVVKNLLRIGTGKDALRPYDGSWREMRCLFKQDQLKNSEIAAIAAFDGIGRPDTKIEDLMAGSVRDPNELAGMLHETLVGLVGEIHDHRDKHVVGPTQIASRFVGQMIQMAGDPLMSVRDFVMSVLSPLGIRSSDIGPETTVADIRELVIFRSRLRVAAESSNLPWPSTIDGIEEDQLPSAIVDRSLRQERQDQGVRYGSELIDRYLASLAPYADITFVDKRTKENFRRAMLKSPKTQELVRRVEKASDYSDVIDIV